MKKQRERKKLLKEKRIINRDNITETDLDWKDLRLYENEEEWLAEVITLVEIDSGDF